MTFLQSDVLAADVRINTEAAYAVMDAVVDPDLTREKALQIARLSGNVALRKKIETYGQIASEEAFATALVGVAKAPASVSDTGNDRFGFSKIKRDHANILMTLRSITTDPENFSGWVRSRVASFAPESLVGTATGYILAGGPSAGFAFDDAAFYLDIGRFAGDLKAARAVTAHELYHSVQVMAVKQRGRPVVQWWDETEAQPLSGDARRCYATDAFFGRMMTEGTASFVGDVTALDINDGAASKFQKERFERGLGRIDRHIALLELATIGLTVDQPISFDDAYLLGFHQDENLYFLGFAMTRAIVRERGSMIISQLISEPGSAFVRAYMSLAAYGREEDVPRLRPHTEVWALASEATCPTRSAELKASFIGK